MSSKGTSTVMQEQQDLVGDRHYARTIGRHQGVKESTAISAIVGAWTCSGWNG